MIFRFARDDDWNTQNGTVLRYDKLEHLILFFAAQALCEQWVYGWWGGEGFSWRDFVADFVGIVLAIGIFG